jgi:hypothetical protein
VKDRAGRFEKFLINRVEVLWVEVVIFGGWEALSGNEVL